MVKNETEGLFMKLFEKEKHQGVGNIDTNWSLYRVRAVDGLSALFDINRVVNTLAWACRGYETVVCVQTLLEEMRRNIFDGIAVHEVEEALILAATAFIERDPAYSKVTARLMRKKLFKEVTGYSLLDVSVGEVYRTTFKQGIAIGFAQGIFDERLGGFDIERLAQELVPAYDELFEYMGIKTVYERYVLKTNGVRFELLQAFWMRVAMGLAINESNKDERAIEFYRLIGTMRYTPSTPTLLHAGLVRPQLSSCFLTTVEDDLTHIFKCIGDNAQMSKWSGGVANDWTNIRAIGAEIESIKVESQGVIPFLRVVNDTTAAINRSGKRRGATVVYLENWHLEFEDFLDLRKNTGDERRRTHDINTAAWIPDLFVKRVLAQGKWTLFSPNDVPELHHLYGRAFEAKYIEYEQKAEGGLIPLHKQVDAQGLWRKMLSRLFETGHPWITFKDPGNIRSPQDHAGVIHSSNLCTEIFLNTSADETAVCNLGSINVSEHIIGEKVDDVLLARTVTSAMRMLDNVIDINFYPTKEGKNSNMLHRPVGLGQMGLQDALYKLNIAFDSKEALVFADTISEKIAYHAILASSHLARERGTYTSYKGSKWDRGLLPQDTLVLLEQERGMPLTVKRTESLDWTPVRESVKQNGMRNSNCIAIAPTATISNIVGCFPCIEPIYKNLYVKANMSGEFTIVNKYLVEDLKKLGLWNQDMLDQIKYYDGSIQQIDGIPLALKHKYKEAFELDPFWLIDIAATRAQWIDQSQSYNIFIKGASGKLIDEVYKYAWSCGLKSTYYCRTLGASQIEKSTLDAQKFGFTQKRVYSSPTISMQERIEVQQEVRVTVSDDQAFQDEQNGRSCGIDDSNCESCQ